MPARRPPELIASEKFCEREPSAETRRITDEVSEGLTATRITHASGKIAASTATIATSQRIG